ncbi:MAG: FxsA family protein [Gammaproteobacteria bacterium]|nr:FxsA family protein [Gammaproteobacteria bacterium]
MNIRISKIIRVLVFLLPLLEIAGFIVVGSWLGVLPTLLLIVLTTFLGFFVIRTQGFMTMLQVQRRVQAGEHPAQDVLGGALLMFGGVLLVLPGFITDIMGFLLLIPAVRGLVLRLLVHASILSSGPAGADSRAEPPSGRTIEGEFQRADKKKDQS